MYYFAFGSNLNQSQMELRLGKVPLPKRAVLSGYKLVFNKWASTRGCCAANIIKTGNTTDIVEGVIYELTDSQLTQLDISEGYNPNLGSRSLYSYRRQQIIFFTDDEQHIEVETYIADKGTSQRIHQPNLEYMNNLLKGRPFLSDDYYNMLLDHPLCDGQNARSRLSLVDSPAPSCPIVYLANATNHCSEVDIAKENDAIRTLKSKLDTVVTRYENNAGYLDFWGNERKAANVKNAIARADKVLITDMNGFLDYKESGKKSIREELAHHRIGFFGKPRGQEEVELFVGNMLNYLNALIL